jgi:FMN phosphatase YigB (HAD superfamily)
LVIGDSLTSDCDGAIAYGLDICRYNPARLSDEGRAITYTVTELNQLAQILNAGGSNDGSCI